MAALEATVYVLYLGSNGLYIINEVGTISLPRTLFEVKDGRISKVFESLNILKKFVMNVKQINQNFSELCSIKEMDNQTANRVPNEQQSR
ncbi:unnamed protein product [Mucor hiemalis]